MSLLLRTLPVVAVACLLSPVPALCQQVDDRISVAADDWPWWRGPNRNGVANAGEQPPTEWSATKNVAWKTPVPGRGHSSPIVVGPRVFLATADEDADTQSVLCYDRATGEPVWQAQVHSGGIMRKHERSTGASGSVACDGENVYVLFANSGAVYLTALSVEGEQLWQTKLADYKIHQGYGASPAVYRSLVIASADSHAGGVVAGLDRKTGKTVWQHDRPEQPNYTSPIILNVAGRDQLLMTGCDRFLSLDPMTGETLWETPGTTTECVTSTVTDGKRIFSTGGYPKSHVSAAMADGSGEIAWETKDRVYVPSILVKDGHLFAVMDAGIAVCWQSDTGEEKWKKRLGGTFSASPVLVGDLIYATNDDGETFIYRADPTKYDQLAQNQLGDSVMGSSAICGDRIYMRLVEKVDGKRQEMLYCVAEEK